ncbi:uncharacterized protein LOC135958399 [Calliphora vicina]|uniref:uncharacterized protein LOC135958399 n=1 Tax=Calliphora vicina TaxID=7373 RepID=UPI00325BED6D
MDTWLVTVTLLVGVLGSLYVFLMWNYGKWRKRGIPEAKSYPVAGSFPSILTQKRHIIYDIDEIYRKYKNTDRFVGVYQSRSPQLLILDPELVHRIYVNDFKSFHDNEFSDFVDEKSDLIMANNPFVLKGDKWKERRLEIVPGMTPSRIKNAYPVTLDVCKRLTQYIKEQSKKADKSGLNTHDFCLRYTSEVVTDCVLGIKAESLTDKPTPILNMIHKLFDQSIMFLIYQIVVGLLPSLKHFYKMTLFPKKSRKFFFNLLQQSIDMRRQQNDGGDRVDFLNYLIQLQDKKGLSTNEMASHVMTFLTDGFITTASVIAHCLLGLARNQEAQEKLRQEILANQDSEGILTFEKLSELPYLEACFHESLRLFPPLVFVTKLCTVPTELINKNGQILKLKENDIIMLSHYSLYHDSNNFEDPEEFKPERFLPKNGGIKKYRDQGKFVGFGDGPRICLGMRFALTQGKAAIVELVRNFNIKSNSKTRSDNLLDKSEFISRLDGGVWLDFEPRNVLKSRIKQNILKMDTWLVTVTLLVGVLGLLYIFLMWNYGKWRKRGIAEAKSYPVAGSFPSILTQKRHIIYDIDEIYREYKNTDRFVGVYQSRSPQLLILDPELVHRIHVNDFKSFHDNEFSDFVDEKSDLILANNPFVLKGAKWKERRLEIVPGMTPNRIKNAYPVTLDVCKRLSQYIKEQSNKAGQGGLNSHEFCLRYTSEVVTDCVLGIKAESLTDKPTPILNMINELFDQTVMFLIYQIAVGLLPSLKHFYKMNMFPEKTRKFFFNLMEQTIKIRRQQSGGSDRVDFLNYLLQLQDKKGLTSNEMASHVMTFLTDGFITTASAIAHCFLGLARNQEAQEKLRQEILTNLDSEGILTFEKLSELPYLEACFHESLRLFPPLLFVTKLCTEPTELVNKNGQILKLKENDIIMLSHYSLYHDSNNFEDPEEFKPERFLPENGGIKKYRDQGKFLGFGDGPRTCLGMRFALTQGKAAIVELVRNFNIKPNPKTRSDNLLDKAEFISRLDGGVWLDFEPRNKMLLITLWLLLAVVALIYIFLIWNFNYWKIHQVNGPKPRIIFGNLPSAITKKRHFMYDIWDIYKSYKYTDDFVGIFKNRTPQLLILSPELARRIYVSDFKHFHDNEQVELIDDKTDFLFANNPFVAGGEKWKERRSQIIPGLTSQRIKNMFPVTLEICRHMCSYIEQQIKVPPKEGIDGKDLASRFMADIIADCVMGLKSDSFKDHNSSPLLIMQHKMFEYSFIFSSLVGLFPGILKFYKQRFLTKDFEDYFLGLMSKAIDLRKSINSNKSMEERADFLNYILQMQEKKNLSQMEISAHTMTFVLDGFETVSSVLAHGLLMLARHPEIQQKLRTEIRDNVGTERNFEIISELPYLNACIHEILRFFPVIFFSRKLCTESLELTNKNGKTYKVPKGLVAIVPQYAIMMDENIYCKPFEFQPERFLEENGGVKKYFDMGAYWGYGDGPRICLGIRFGLVQIKAALVEILSKFVVKPNPKTRNDYKFDPHYFLARLDGGIFLDFESL